MGANIHGYGGREFKSGVEADRDEVVVRVGEMKEKQVQRARCDHLSPAGVRSRTHGWACLGIGSSFGIELLRRIEPILLTDGRASRLFERKLLWRRGRGRVVGICV